MSITPRVALVTGGSRGIGKAIAAALLADGLSVAVTGTQSDRSVTDLFGENTKGRAFYAVSDVSNIEEHSVLLDNIESELGPVSVLVNNAGVAPVVRADLLESRSASFDRVMGINLRGPHFLTQEVARRWVAEEHERRFFDPCVVFVTSISATHASINRGEYCISKAGLTMSAQLWAVRLAEFGIGVYEVRPGIIATDMTSGVHEIYDRRIAEGLVPERRWGTPEDVGTVVAALVGAKLPFSTGAVIPVDGGLSINRL